MKIYIACVGYDYEGYDVKGVFSTKKAAEKDLEQYIALGYGDTHFILERHLNEEYGTDT